MSYFNNYRINFYGGISANPCTANNDDRGKCFVDQVAGLMGPDYISQIDEDISDDLKESPGWNLFGDFSCTFEDASITTSGIPGEVKKSASLAGKQVKILGDFLPQSTSRRTPPTMVDVDSTGVTCTQILVGGFLIGDEENPLLLIEQNTRSFTRTGMQYPFGKRSDFVSEDKKLPGFVNFGTYFQMGFQYDEGWKYDETNPEIVKLVGLARENKGIIVSFAMFQPNYKYSEAEVKAKYEENENPENPVYAYNVGNIGVWEKHETATAIPGRFLVQNKKSPVTKCAFAELDESRRMITLQLANAFDLKAVRKELKKFTSPPETTAPRKVFLAINKGQNPEIVAAIPYQNDKYHTFGGLVDVELSKEQLDKVKSHPIVICDLENNMLFQEQEYRIESDDRGIYQNPGDRTTLRFRLSHLGRPVQNKTKLELTLSPSGHLEKDFKNYRVENSYYYDQGGKEIQFKRTEKEETEDGTTINWFEYRGEFTAQPDPEGWFSLDAVWKAPGCKTASLYFNRERIYYWVMRNYPKDDYSSIPDTKRKSWDFVYKEVLRFYYLTFPTMTTRFPLNDKTLVSGPLNHAILNRISEEGLHKTFCMPITRDMSPGKRKLLEEYLLHAQKKKSEEENQVS